MQTMGSAMQEPNYRERRGKRTATPFRYGVLETQEPA